MLATAFLMGDLGPSGVRCPACNGDAVVEEETCTACEDGRVKPTEEQEKGGGIPLDALHMAQLVCMSREKSWAPLEWLEQPAEFELAWRIAAPVIRDIEEKRSSG